MSANPNNSPGSRVKIRFFNAGPQAEVDVSQPHVIVENEGDVHEVSSELAFKLIRAGRAEEADIDEPVAEVEEIDEALAGPGPSSLLSFANAFAAKAESRPPAPTPETEPESSDAEPEDKTPSALD